MKKTTFFLMMFLFLLSLKNISFLKVNENSGRNYICSEHSVLLKNIDSETVKQAILDFIQLSQTHV